MSKVLKKMVVLRQLSASDLSDGDYITLQEGMILEVESMKKRDDSFDLVCRNVVDKHGNHHARVKAGGCPDYTFQILNDDEKPLPPVFKKISPKLVVGASNSTLGQSVRIPIGTALTVETVYPNDTEWTRQYTFVVRNQKNEQIRLSGVTRSMFAVIEGEGQSIWDEDIEHPSH